ncbi:MAG: hypothetical protein K0R71_1507 [Bacillales bacterium]|jgi:hypothetical protein|nr:hypothetical protein [Bacillales bacterium]
MIPPITRINAIPKYLPKKINSDKKEKTLKSLNDRKSIFFNVGEGRTRIDIKA